MTAVAVFMTGGLIFSGCSEDDIKDIVAGQADPVPGPTANLVVTTTPEAVLGLMNALLPVPGVVVKPSATGITAATTSVTDKNCGSAVGISGGSVDFTPDDPPDANGDYTAKITGCRDENVEINGDVVGTIGPIVVTCIRVSDGTTEILPTSMTSTFTGTVDVLDDAGNSKGEVLTFTNFGVAATGIEYGPECNLNGGKFKATVTGSVSGNISGAALGIDFGTASFVVDVISIEDPTGLGDGQGREVTMDISGTITVDTPCQSGSLTITTTQLLKTLQPNVCPFEGTINISGDFGTVSQTFNGNCDLAACTL